MKTGVFSTSEGWTWQCDLCPESAAAPVSDRVAARDAYKVHRASHKEEAPTPEQTKPTQEATKSVPTAKKKKTAKKAAKKKVVAKRKAAKKKTATKRANVSKDGKKVWRIGVHKSPHTGRLVTPNVNKKGQVFACHEEQLGFRKCASFATVRAATRKEALALIKKKAKSVEWTGKVVALP